MQRRNFLRTSGIFAASFYASRAHAIAGPFLPGEVGHNIPIDKKLDPQWVASLFKRGFVTKYTKSKNELQYIGMPVGGINTGMMYLGGDGRLWLWDIFNANQLGVNNKTIEWHSQLHVGKTVRPQDGSAYVQPEKDIRPVEQGFAFQIHYNGKTFIKKMQADDWDDIVFEATYPMAKLRYIDKLLPLEITADIYSPFIPLDDKNSGLPATIYSFHCKNKSDKPIQVDIIGWLENKVCIHSATKNDIRVNAIVKEDLFACTASSIKQNTNEKQTHLADYGTMGIMSLNQKSVYHSNTNLNELADAFKNGNEETTESTIDKTLISSVSSSMQLKPGSASTLDFALAWHFPNLKLNAKIQGEGRYYNNWFKSSTDVLKYIRQHFNKLSTESKLWRDTFYDSTLPWWFLERTFLNISTMATTTAHRFESGRFYAWEGVGCCEGTCTHVWQYAQAVGRIFPNIEKDTRERVDLGLSLQPDGMMWYRGEVVKGPAIDGQAGTILRIYREHQMSADDTFLKNNWDKIKRATQWVLNQDRNQDGMEDTPIENTLDAVWDGEISWLVGLCIAAVKAAQMMATEMNDTAFASLCKEYVEKGMKNMDEQLFNGEYFIHKPDATKGRQKLGSYNTCHIDQVYGQSWAFQVGLGRVINKEKTLSALNALWKYNFTPDVGPYIKDHTGGRPYALAGDGGLIMNTNPKNETKPYGENVTWQLGYFHECMSGFEHQVAAHMMAEGMTKEAMVITRMIHDRYHAAKRNPFNEIECSDHYARAMASYGTFITACGFEYHGPKGYMKFAPKIQPENFKAPFTSASGWGTFSQQQHANGLKASIKLNHGALKLKSFVLEHKNKPTHVSAVIGDTKIPLQFAYQGQECIITFDTMITIQKNQTLHISI